MLTFLLYLFALVLFLWAFFDNGANIDGHPLMPLAFAAWVLAILLSHTYVVERWRREP